MESSTCSEKNIGISEINSNSFFRNDLKNQNHTLPLLNSTKADQSPSEQPDFKKSSFAGVLSNLLNSAIGASILAMPYVMSQLGVLGGSIAIILGAIFLSICSPLLQKTKSLSGQNEYLPIAEHCFQSKGTFLISASLIMSNVGSCIVYLSYFAQTMQNLLGYFISDCQATMTAHPPFLCQNFTLRILGGLIVFPFTFIRSFGNIGFISYIKVISIVIFAGVTIGYCIYGVIHGIHADHIDLFPKFNQPVDTLACITEIIIAYNFTFNQFSIFKSMDKPSDSRFIKAVQITMAISMVSFIAVGFCGYFSFGDNSSNLLSSFTVKELGAGLFLLLNASFSLFLLTSYPSSFFAPRNTAYAAILKAFHVKDPYEDLADTTREKNKRSLIENPKKAKIIYNITVVAGNGLVILLAVVAPDVNDIFGLVGAVASNALVFLFPAAFYLKLTKKGDKGRVLSVSLIAFGIFIGIIGFVTNVLKIFVEKS